MVFTSIIRRLTLVLLFALLSKFVKSTFSLLRKDCQDLFDVKFPSKWNLLYLIFSPFHYFTFFLIYYDSLYENDFFQIYKPFINFLSQFFLSINLLATSFLPILHILNYNVSFINKLSQLHKTYTNYFSFEKNLG